MIPADFVPFWRHIPPPRMVVLLCTSFDRSYFLFVFSGIYSSISTLDWVKINEHDMVVSLPSSLTGVVRRREVSDWFYQRAAASGKHSGGGRGGGRSRYYDESQGAGDKALADLFHEGQVSEVKVK